jgi:putative phosphoribosyl transferase
MTRYADRQDAGVALAGALDVFAGREDVVVLGVPRGGVVVAAPVAAALNAPLDLVVVRKLGLPGRPELAMGAITDVAGEVAVVRNEDVLRRWPVPEESAQAVLRAELAELRRREGAYRGGRPPVSVTGRTAIVVDDGLATGASMRAAVAGVRGLGAETVVVAVPVGAAEPCRLLHRWADDVVCLWTPRPFRAVAEAYRDFSPTPDEEVLRALRPE